MSFKLTDDDIERAQRTEPRAALQEDYDAPRRASSPAAASTSRR